MFVVRIRPRERILTQGKAGRAYGFHIENAYYRDLKTGRAFFLAATIHANADGVMNDDKYEYDTVTRPFLANLGAVVARAVFDGRRRRGAPPAPKP